MTDKKLISALFLGAFVSRRNNRDKRCGYAIYIDQMIVCGSVTDKQFRRFHHLFKERRGRFTFNLNLVRQLHGSALPKKLYKQSKISQHYVTSRNSNQANAA